jgi:hypothetical protein
MRTPRFHRAQTCAIRLPIAHKQAYSTKSSSYKKRHQSSTLLTRVKLPMAYKKPYCKGFQSPLSLTHIVYMLGKGHLILYVIFGLRFLSPIFIGKGKKKKKKKAKYVDMKTTADQFKLVYLTYNFGFYYHAIVIRTIFNTPRICMRRRVKI